VIAPWRRSDWPFTGRPEMIAYANEKNIPVTATREKPYSMDRNLVHISYEGGILEDPWREPYNDIFRLTVSPEDAPNTPEYIEIEYDRGDPIAINGTRLGPAQIIERANEIAGRHGIGRVDLVENRYVGIKSRGVYESPGTTILMHGHRGVEQLTLDREVMHMRDSLVSRYAEMVYNGFWFAPEREALQALIDDTQKNVNGVTRLKLFKGAATIVGRKSPNSLYDMKMVSFDEAGGYQQADAEGLIRLAGVRLRALARANAKR
jgi:argininosuccinate synthase